MLTDATARADERPLRVKFLPRGEAAGDYSLWLRQFPGRIPRWGRCEFVFEPEVRDYDWLAVYDDLPPNPGERRSLRVEELGCPRAHTLLITTEPSSIKPYGRGYLRQFGYVLTSQEPWAIPHPHPIFSQSGYRWFYGVGSQGVRDYDQMCAAAPREKTGLISTVTSSKRQRHTLHHRRYDFVQQIKQSIPELEVFGHGVRPIDDKAEAMDAFRYHIAIENHVCAHHWTEKLADCYLALAMPFYHGAPNVAEYFPEGSFVAIDIDDLEGSVRKIRAAIGANLYETNLPLLEEARRRVLQEYNLFALLSRLISERHDPSAVPVRGARILGRHAFQRRYPWHAAERFLERGYRLLRRRA